MQKKNERDEMTKQKTQNSESSREGFKLKWNEKHRYCIYFCGDSYFCFVYFGCAVNWKWFKSFTQWNLLTHANKINWESIFFCNMCVYLIWIKFGITFARLSASVTCCHLYHLLIIIFNVCKQCFELAFSFYTFGFVFFFILLLLFIKCLARLMF